MIQATGHQLSIGDKKMFAATRVTLGGSNTIDINRSGRVYEGTVASTKKAKVRGQEHLLVKLETYDDKMLLADLGPAEKLSGKIKQGAEVTLHGILVRSKERVVLLTREVDLGDETVQIQQHQNRS